MKRLILFLSVLLLFTCSYGQGIIRANSFTRAVKTGGLGEELVTNGDFSVGTGWTLSSATITDNKLEINCASFTICATQAIGIEVGKTYTCSFTIISSDSGLGVVLAFGDWSHNVYSEIKNSPGTHTFDLTVSDIDTPLTVSIWTLNNVWVGSVDNISVKEKL
jgi:hypothetical protein